MGPSTIKAFLFSVLLAIFEIPFDLLGRYLVGNNYTTTERWSAISFIIMSAMCAVIYAKVVNTKLVKDLSSVMSFSDADRQIEVATLAPPTTPIKAVIAVAEKLKKEEVITGKPITVTEAVVSRELHEARIDSDTDYIANRDIK